MDNDAIRKMIKQHEGYRGRIYIDSVGVPTGGYGHAFLTGSPLSQPIWELIFEEDFQRTVNDYDYLVEEYNLDLNPVRRGVLIDMLFNLGLSKLLRFKKFIRAMQLKDWERAADEMINSRWYNQVGTRAVKLVKMMREGK